MEVVMSLLRNHVLICGIAAWLIAQILKSILYFLTNKQFRAERLIGAGGMPSCHSACVCAAAIAVAKVSGISSSEFALAFLLAAIVIYDATGVRRAAGEHARILNKLIDEMPDDVVDEIIARRVEDPGKVKELLSHMKRLSSREGKEKDEEEEKPLKEFLGHTPLEVIAGALLGILVAMVMPLF